MRLYFGDSSNDFELLRSVGYAPYDGAEVGECIATAGRIREGDDESWWREWKEVADRVASGSPYSGPHCSTSSGLARGSSPRSAARCCPILPKLSYCYLAYEPRASIPDLRTSRRPRGAYHRPTDDTSRYMRGALGCRSETTG